MKQKSKFWDDIRKRSNRNSWIKRKIKIFDLNE